MLDNILLSRNVIKSLQICFFCFEGKSGKFYFINKREFRIEQDLQGCVQRIDLVLGKISGCTRFPFKFVRSGPVQLSGQKDCCPRKNNGDNIFRSSNR